MKVFKLLILFLFLQSGLYAQVSLKSGVSRSSINIGDFIRYYIIITYNADTKLILPPPGKELGGFDIKDYNIYDERSKDKYIKIKKIEYTITTYFLADFQIPSIEIKYEDKNKAQQTIKTEPLMVKVVPITRLPTDTDDIRDIKKQEYLKTHLGLYIFLIILLISAGLAAYYYYKKNYKKTKDTALPSKSGKILPEDIEALDKIKELINRKLIENSLVKLFYFNLAEIIRAYLYKRFNILTLERTSFEIMTDLTKIHLDKKILASFDDFFIDSDMVKFAKYQPFNNEIKGIIDRAIELINSTKREQQANEIL